MRIKGRHEYERRPTFNGVDLVTVDETQSIVNAHANLTNNPHAVTAAQIGLGNVDNTSDLLKPVSIATQMALDLKENTIVTLPINKGGTNSQTALNNNRVMISNNGAIVENPALTASRALVTNAFGLPEVSPTTATEISFVSGVTSGIQGQIDALVFGREFQYSTLATFSTTSKTLVTAHTFTTTSLPAGTYRIGWCFTLKNSSSNKTVVYSTQVEGIATRQNGVFRPSNAAIYEPHFIEEFQVLTAGTKTISLQVGTSGGTVTVYNINLSIWRVA